MSEELKTQCRWCGKTFEAHSGSFIEVGLSALPADEDLSEEDGVLAFEPWMSNEAIADQLGVTAEEVERMLSGEHVDTGAEAVCDDCQKQFDETLTLPDPLT